MLSFRIVLDVVFPETAEPPTAAEVYSDIDTLICKYDKGTVSIVECEIFE
jgi:hypothetical protein